MQAYRTRITAATAIAPLTWGSTYAVTTQWLPAGEPLLTATVRALPAGLLLLAATRRLPSGGWWWRAAVLGTLNIGAFFALLFVAAYRLPGGMAAVLGAIQPLIVAGLSVPVLRQRPSRLTLLAGAVGVGGVALVVLQAVVRPDPLGVAAGLGGAAAMATGIVLGKRWGRPAGVSVLAFTGWQLAFGGLLLAPAALLSEGLPSHLTAVNLGGYLYLAGINTLLAYWLWFRGTAALAPTALSFLSLLSPVCAAVIGWLALGQHLSPLQILGLLLALGGTVLGQLRPTTRRKAEPCPESSKRPISASTRPVPSSTAP
ncbi:EamA family transporter [Actinospica sp. MGRD01-02]|uniref:EamA family transporter n=1 Tax=Actinospica acidithermotolerans TaxID=2828514 RepID=A0A941IHK2_9ACTN|nr:EamA family transporter [Actinospica acidithermotolerans]MBR7825268.1 EamA family transporter [Actinospica acidithermotolerans]